MVLCLSILPSFISSLIDLINVTHRLDVQSELAHAVVHGGVDDRRGLLPLLGVVPGLRYESVYLSHECGAADNQT